MTPIRIHTHLQITRRDSENISQPSHHHGLATIQKINILIQELTAGGFSVLKCHVFAVLGKLPPNAYKN
jgi:hypothetical protein